MNVHEHTCNSEDTDISLLQKYSRGHKLAKFIVNLKIIIGLQVVYDLVLLMVGS